MSPQAPTNPEGSLNRTEPAEPLPFLANRLHIDAQWIERKPMRYTPAGLPVAQGTLQYAGQVLEAGAPRQVRCELPAVAVGPASQPALAVGMGKTMRFFGFLAAGRNGKGLVFHIDRVDELPAPGQVHMDVQMQEEQGDPPAT